jgi:hypothetical protein
MIYLKLKQFIVLQGKTKCECPIAMTDEEFVAGIEGESGPQL